MRLYTQINALASLVLPQVINWNSVIKVVVSCGKLYQSKFTIDFVQDRLELGDHIEVRWLSQILRCFYELPFFLIRFFFCSDQRAKCQRARSRMERVPLFMKHDRIAERP